MALRIDILTLFPGMLTGFLAESILGRGVAAGHLTIEVHDIRQWALSKHRNADDRPFGGGAGMVLRPDVVVPAIEALQTPGCRRIYLTPDGVPFSEAKARELAAGASDPIAGPTHVILLSGHYEGIDQRIRDLVIDEELSIGDYVLTNGTLPAAVVVDALARFIPGVLGEENSLTQESFTGKLLDFPQYTRPAEFRGMPVPEVLLSGNHGKIEQWREAQRIEKTRFVRPDLFEKYRHELHH